MRLFPRHSLAPLVCALLAVTAGADVVINEVMYHPVHAVNSAEPVAEEYIELYNTDPLNAVPLTGWSFSSGVSYTFSSAQIPAGGYLVVVADPVTFAAKYPSVGAVVLGPWDGRLSNDGERLRLINAAGEEVDDLIYADEGDWARRVRGPFDRGHRGWLWQSDADGGGASLELRNPQLSNKQGQNWSTSPVGGETPGAANLTASTDIPPMIRNVRHLPAIPSSSDFVTVTCRLTDELSTGLTAVVHFRPTSSSPGAFTALPMADDSLNGDGDAGDGVYGAVLPSFPEDTVVEFYVAATDAGGGVRTWPAASDEFGSQSANALYQVEDAALAPADGLPAYRLIMSASEDAEFAHGNFETDSDAQMNATFIARVGGDIDVRYLAGLRRRGAGSRDDNPRTMRLNLVGDDPWDGTTRLNLNGNYTYLQILGQKLFAASCLPSAVARPVTLFINGDGESIETPLQYGAYAHMEPQGSESVTHQFPDDDSGNLYRKRRPSTDMAYRNGNVADYLSDGWTKSSNRSEWDWGDLDAWLAALNDTGNPNYLSNLEVVMDVDQWLRWFAVMALLNNGETNPSTGLDDDYYAYSGVLDPRMKAIPHDLDTILSFGDVSANSNPTHTIYDMVESGDVIPVLNALMRHPAVVPRYHREFRDLIAGPFSKLSFDAMVENCLGGYVPSSRRNAIIAFMDARRAYVLSLVDPALGVDIGLSQSGGFPRSFNSQISLSGSVDIAEAAQVRVNGQLAMIDYETATWELNGPVFNEVTVLGAGAGWLYLDDGSDQGTSWRGVGFDDSGWKAGNAELGYGDGDEVTEVLFGPNPDNANNNPNAKFITTYFRTDVTIPDPSIFTDFTLSLKRDDGAAVFVNGSEVLRDNLPAGAAYDTFASSTAAPPAEDTFFDFTVPASAFVAGINTIAVEVHQRSVDNTDLSFDLSLVGREQLSTGMVQLTPGINRMLVEALDATGAVVETTTLDVWYDDGDEATISGTLTADTTLTAAAGPYLVTADLTVPAGITLTIESGASVYFAQDTRLTVNGRLDASGDRYRRIRFTVEPGSGDTWDGVYFIDTLEDNRMTFLDQEFSSAASHSLEVDDARLWLENVQWRGTTETVLEISGPQLDVIDCDFPSSSGEEVIHGASLSGADWFHLVGNVFQTSSGYNDIIDFSGGRRPGPIIYVIGNTFNGGTDDCLDLDGIDAHIEGNSFYNIHTDDASRPSTSNAIATDGNAHVTVVRNVFDDVDHALLLKNDADAVFENNVVRGASLGAISFNEPLRTVDAGSDITVRANVFIDNAVTFRFPNHLDGSGTSPQIVADGNIMPAAEHGYGTGNIDIDPAFVDAAGRDFRLLPGSPALSGGINGSDLGAMVPRWATISGEPPALTSTTTASLQVYMPGISGIESGTFVSEYRWRLNGGPWSADTDTTVPITLSGLADGSYTVQVVGKDSAGYWQADADATVSRTWVVDSSYTPAVRLNEVLADSSSGSDWIEIHNPAAVAVDISGYRLSDDASGSGAFTMPAGTVIPAGDYLMAYADSLAVPAGLHSGFGLDRGGEGVFLFEPTATGGALLDAIEFGVQITDLSIGRHGPAAEWTLTVPTPLAENERQGTGDPKGLRLNEVLAAGTVVFCEDFIEIYNPASLPVDLGGMHLTDNPGGNKTKYTIPALSYIPASGFVAIEADENSSRGADHANFKLDANSEWAALYTAGLEEVDIVAFASQQDDVSLARVPDGSASWQLLPVPTPGLSNGGGMGTSTEVSYPLVALGSTWRYEDTGTDLGTSWRASGYNDSTWASGPGLLGFEDATLPAPGLQTVFTDPGDNSPYIPTYYFRQEFTYTGDTANTVLDLSAVVDDGVVIYLNGQEIYRQSIPAGQSYATLASDTVGTASVVGPLEVPASSLVSGVNVLAAELHQTNTGSSDMVFGMTLDATETVFTPSDNAAYGNIVALVEGLRISEVMYDPAEGTDVEFIELHNIGNEMLELEGVRFTEGIDFVFPALTLAQGQFAVLVHDPVAFATKYGSGPPVVGQYLGKLSNGGEQLVLQLPAPYTGNIQKFTYDDSWYPLADGGGVSLEIIDLYDAVVTWDDQQAWRPGAIDGTPGSLISLSAGNARSAAVGIPVQLNGEVLGSWAPTLSWSQLSGPATAVINGAATEDPTLTLPLPGAYVFELSGTDGGALLTSRTSVTVIDDFTAWSLRTGTSGVENDDPDCDGVPNLLEYAFDLDPSVADSELLPVALFPSAGAELQFQRSLHKSDLQYQVEVSGNLKAWLPVGDNLISATSDSELRSYLTPAWPGGFVRVTVSR